MDRIQKFLLKLTKKQRAIFLEIFQDIHSLNLNSYDIKALQGLPGLFRLRKGDIRIIFTKKDQQGFIVDIAHRKDIYKK